jgi:F-type H+-transporting ATPase subunit b
MPFADSNFLIPNATFIVELVAFLIVLGFLARVVLPPLRKALDDRASKIQGELAAADEAKADAAAADAERRGALEDARHQAREIVAQANRTADQVAAQSQARAQDEYERIVGSARSEVDLARQRAVEEAANRLGEIVIGVVERIVEREVNAETHRDLIEEAARALTESPDASEAASGGGARS